MSMKTQWAAAANDPEKKIKEKIGHTRETSCQTLC